MGRTAAPYRSFCTIATLTSPMARVTSISRGQADVQLKIVRQRHTPVRLGQNVEALLGGLVAAVEDEAVRLDNRRRADVRAVRPEAGAARRAARAQDTLGRVVEALAVLDALQPFARPCSSVGHGLRC